MTPAGASCLTSQVEVFDCLLIADSLSRRQHSRSSNFMKIYTA